MLALEPVRFHQACSLQEGWGTPTALPCSNCPASVQQKPKALPGGQTRLHTNRGAATLGLGCPVHL